MAKVKENNENEVNAAYLEGVLEGYTRINELIERITERRELDDGNNDDCMKALELIQDTITAEINYAEALKDTL